MALNNKLGITDAAELAREEERISKKKALELFKSGYLDTLKPGTFSALSEIHRYLFDELYDFVRDMGFDRLGCFAYSKEEGTKAALMKPQVRSDVKERCVPLH